MPNRSFSITRNSAGIALSSLFSEKMPSMGFWVCKKTKAKAISLSFFCLPLQETEIDPFEAESFGLAGRLLGVEIQIVNINPQPFSLAGLSYTIDFSFQALSLSLSFSLSRVFLMKQRQHFYRQIMARWCIAVTGIRCRWKPGPARAHGFFLPMLWRSVLYLGK